jgi:hypothetical protein
MSVIKSKRQKGKVWSRFSGRALHGNVVLNYRRFPKGELGAYARSYHEAAKHLVKRIVTAHYRDPDACPIVFLYRHAVELYLKSITYWGDGVLGMNGKPVAKKSVFTEHRLRVLLKGVQPIVRFQGWTNGWGDSNFPSFRDVEKLIGELDEFDPGSYAFRYPVDTTGKKATLPHHFLFNVVAFGEKFDQLMATLDYMLFIVYEEFQSQAEVKWEMEHGN